MQSLQSPKSAHLRSPVHLLKLNAGNLATAFMFEKLEVYQKAIDFADQVAALTEQFPRGYPPDMQQQATELVLQHAEVLCKDWTA